jgi:glutamate carboxypeptidase
MPPEWPALPLVRSVHEEALRRAIVAYSRPSSRTSASKSSAASDAFAASTRGRRPLEGPDARQRLQSVEDHHVAALHVGDAGASSLAPHPAERLERAVGLEDRIEVADDEEALPARPPTLGEEVSRSIHLGGHLDPTRLEAEGLQIGLQDLADPADAGLVHRAAVDVDQALQKEDGLLGVAAGLLRDARFVGAQGVRPAGEDGAHEAGRGEGHAGHYILRHTENARVKDLLDWARAHRGEMVSLLRVLVEIESPSTDAAAVAALAARLVPEAEGMGLAVETIPVEGTGPVLRARTATPASRAKPIMVLGHLDTVWPKGTLAARPIRVEGDRLFGPGSYDMKAGIVVALFALRALATRGALPSVTLFLTPYEEVGCEPYRALMETEMAASAAVLDFEPAWPGGAVKTARKGSGSFVVRARGRAAHAGADFEKGANAICELSRRVLDAAALTDLGRGITVNVGVIRGGIRSNVVPDHAEAEIDFRVRTLDDARGVEKAIRGLASSDPAVSLEIEGGLNYPPLERGPRVRAVYEAARAVAGEMGLDLAEIATGGASEASFAAALGVPTLDGLGADGDGAHAEHEHVLLSSIPVRAALGAGLIARLATAAP